MNLKFLFVILNSFSLNAFLSLFMYQVILTSKNIIILKFECLANLWSSWINFDGTFTGRQLIIKSKLMYCCTFTITTAGKYRGRNQYLIDQKRLCILLIYNLQKARITQWFKQSSRHCFLRCVLYIRPPYWAALCVIYIQLFWVWVCSVSVSQNISSTRVIFLNKKIL